MFFLINVAKHFLLENLIKKMFHNIFFINIAKMFFIRKFNKKNVAKTFFIRKFDKKKRFHNVFFKDLIKIL
jgi:hypothetical protein